MEYLERSVLPLMLDVHAHVAGSHKGVAGFAGKDGRTRFKEGCRHWVFAEVQKVIILTHPHREIRLMQGGFFLFLSVESLCWHGDKTDGSFGK